MIRGEPVMVEGRVLGIAVSQADGCHFIAADPVVGDLHGLAFASPAEAARIAGLVLARARAIPAALPVLRRPPMLHSISDRVPQG